MLFRQDGRGEANQLIVKDAAEQAAAFVKGWRDGLALGGDDGPN